MREESSPEYALIPQAVFDELRSPQAPDQVKQWIAAAPVMPIKEVTIYSPDSDAPITLKPTGATFTIPELRTYSMAVLPW